MIIKLKKKCLLIGLGNIGFLYNLKSQNRILTHAQAIINNPKLELSAAVDKDYKKITKLNNHYKNHKIITAQSINSLSNKTYDIVVIALPYELQHDFIKKLIKVIKFKNIVIEKPFCKNLKQIREIIKMLKAKKINIFINYIRSLDDTWLEIKKKFKYKKNILGNINFYKDIYTNASHFIHLCLFLFGDCKKIITLNKKKSFRLIFKNSIINFFSVRNRKSTQIQLNSNNLNFIDNNKFYFTLNCNNKKILKKNKIKNYQENIYNFIINKNKMKNEMIKNNLKLSIQTHQIINKLHAKKI